MITTERRCRTRWMTLVFLRIGPSGDRHLLQSDTFLKKTVILAIGKKYCFTTFSIIYMIKGLFVLLKVVLVMYHRLLFTGMTTRKSTCIRLLVDRISFSDREKDFGFIMHARCVGINSNSSIFN